MLEELQTRPLQDFQREAAEWAGELKRSHEPLLLTVDGQAELVIQDAVGYQAMIARLQELETARAVEAGLADVEAGRVEPARVALGRLGAKFGFSR